MAFIPKIWQGREVEHPGRIVLTPTGNPNEYDVSRSEGQVTSEGDFLGTVNLNDLEQRISNGTAAGDGNGNALNALALGGVEAGNYAQVSSGDWLPTFYGATSQGNPTYDTRDGYYVKIGSLVCVTLNISSANFGGATGNLMVGGLPYLPNLNGAYTEICTPAMYTTGTNNIGSVVRIFKNSPNLQILSITSNNGTLNRAIITADSQSRAELRCVFSYPV